MTTVAGTVHPGVAPRPMTAATTESALVRWCLIAAALAFMGLFLVLPLASVFAEALAKGWAAYGRELVTPDALAVSVSDISLDSFLDVDRHGRAGRGGIADVGCLFGRWSGDEQEHHAVVVALVEYVARVQHTLAGGDALVLIDSHFHVRGAPSRVPATSRRSHR